MTSRTSGVEGQMTVSGHLACLSRLLVLWSWTHLCNIKVMKAVKWLWTFSCLFCLCFLYERNTLKIDLVIITQLYFSHFPTSLCYNAFIILQKFAKDLTGTNVSWITQQGTAKQRKHDIEQKCSYFCVGCLSPNSLMLSCKERVGERREERHLGLVCGWRRRWRRGSRV